MPINSFDDSAPSRQLFGISLEEVEGLGGFRGDGLGSFFEVVGDFEEACGIRGKRGGLSGDVVPVDGAAAGPEVIVVLTVVVVEVELRDAGPEECDGFVDAKVVFWMREVGVAYVEGDTDAVEVADVEDFEDVFGGGDFVLQIFDEDADAEGVGEGFEVFDSGEGVLEGAGVPGVVLLAEVEDAGCEGDLLGCLEGALDLVHCGDAVGFFGIDEIDVRGDVAGPLPASTIAEVEGLVERGGDACVAEPCGDVAYGGAVAVVEVVAGGDDFDGLGSAPVQGVEQAGVEALLEEDVGGHGGLHQFLKYSSGGSNARFG